MDQTRQAREGPVGAVMLGEDRVSADEHTIVVIRRNPGNAEKAIGWIFTDGLAALPGLGRKLPHYGKYSYLGFVGPAPDNVAKGEWDASGSPLVAFPGRSPADPTPPRMKLPAREPLARVLRLERHA